MQLILAKVKNYFLFPLMALFLLATPLLAKSLEDKLPAKPVKLVTNLSLSQPDLLKPNEEQTLEYKLTKFSEETKVQIAILITDDLLDLDPNDYSTRIFNKWGIGTKDTNQGVLILIKPTEENGGRVIYISTGYGSEAIIPDASAKQIIEKIIKPNFQEGFYYQGLDKATDLMIEAFKSGNTAVLSSAKEDVNPRGVLIFILLSIVFWIFMAEKVLKNNRSLTLESRHHGTRGRSGDFIPPIFFGGGGGGFGSGGGGFGGFGGGMSGGGGAGGDW